MKKFSQRSKRARSAYVIARSIVTSALLIGAAWSAVYWGVAALRGTIAPAAAGYLVGLAEVYGALAVIAAVASIIAISTPHRKRSPPFQTLIDAMRRIARGDFNVEVPADERQGMLGPVASSLNEMAESLRKVEAMRQEFISDVSHEIRSPLTSIAGFAEALRNVDLDEQQRAAYLDIIESESIRLSRLGDNLLRLSSIETDAQPFSVTSLRLDAQIRSALLAFEPQWSRKKIEVTAELPVVEIRADRAMLEQIWVNLFSNAVKFTPEGGTIVVSLAVDALRVTIVVRDSGIGCSAEELPLLFDRFYKADRSRTNRDRAAGSGLGLSIVEKIVERHGGAIRAESQGRGMGMTMTVTLPIDGAGAPPIDRAGGPR